MVNGPIYPPPRPPSPIEPNICSEESFFQYWNWDLRKAFDKFLGEIMKLIFITQKVLKTSNQFNQNIQNNTEQIQDNILDVKNLEVSLLNVEQIHDFKK